MIIKLNWVKSGTKKIKIWGSINGQIEEFITKDLFAKTVRIRGPNSIENMGRIEKIKSL